MTDAEVAAGVAGLRELVNEKVKFQFERDRITDDILTAAAVRVIERVDKVRNAGMESPT